jgi:MOSC domain-containing protein YiiM
VKLISVNVGLPREVEWKRRTVSTGIFKEPVAGRIMARRENLDGDRQADLAVHGGPEKAIYAYPAEHYDFWREALPEVDFNWGKFGENLTISGLSEETLNIGDKFRIGSAIVMVTQPRLPCYKLAVKFNRDDMLKRFLESGRTGFYFSVKQEGEVGAGDEVIELSRDGNNVTVADIVRLYLRQSDDPGLLAKARQLEPLPESWRAYFRERQS